MLDVELKVVGGKQHNQIIPINEARFLIGRGEDCQLRPDNELVSRHHCVFSVDEFSVRIRDLGSTNGTIVNGEQVHGHVSLNHGDRVTVGTLELEVSIGQPALVGDGGDSDSPAVLPNSAASTEETQDQELQHSRAETVLETPSAPGSDVTGGFHTDETFVSAAETSQAAPETPTASDADTVVGVPLGGQPVVEQPFAPQQFPPQMYPPGYPPQPMPQGMYPPQPYPLPPMQYPQMQPPGETQPPSSGGLPAVTLPKPEDTGAKDEEPDDSSEATESDDRSDSRATAEDIIKKYMQRRPPT